MRERWRKNLDRSWWLWLLLLDWLSKALVRDLGKFVENPGIGWGIGFGEIGWGVVIIAIVLYLFFWGNKWWERLLLVGGVANLGDRVYHGAVTDFINLFGLWINLADIMISVAVVGALINFYTDGKNQSSVRE